MSKKLQKKKLPAFYEALRKLSEKSMASVRWIYNEAEDGEGEQSYIYDNGRTEPNGGTAQATYLLPGWLQEMIFLQNGYIKGDKKDYGLVKSAVGDKNVPVFQTAPDAIKREKLAVIGNDLVQAIPIPESTELYHAGDFPVAYYIDNKGMIYAKAWDLNDYGNTSGRAGTTYDSKQFGANFLDKIGSPVVVTTGFQPYLALKESYKYGEEDGEHISLEDALNAKKYPYSKGYLYYIDDPDGYKRSMIPYPIRDIAEQYAKTHHIKEVDGKWVTTTDKDLIVTPKKNYWVDNENE